MRVQLLTYLPPHHGLPGVEGERDHGVPEDDGERERLAVEREAGLPPEVPRQRDRALRRRAPLRLRAVPP